MADDPLSHAKRQREWLDAREVTRAAANAATEAPSEATTAAHDAAKSDEQKKLRAMLGADDNSSDHE